MKHHHLKLLQRWQHTCPLHCMHHLLTLPMMQMTSHLPAKKWRASVRFYYFKYFGTEKNDWTAVEKLAELQSSKTKQKITRGKRSPKEILLEAKKEYNLPNEIVILETTVRQRLKRNSKSDNCGLTSPMIETEPYIVSIIIQLANMCVPISNQQ